MEYVLGAYIDCCDLRFQVDLSFCNSVEWLRDKILLIDFTTLDGFSDSKELKNQLIEQLNDNRSKVYSNLIYSNKVSIDGFLSGFTIENCNKTIISPWVLSIQTYISYQFESFDKDLTYFPENFQKSQANLFSLILQSQKKSSDLETQKESLEAKTQLEEENIEIQVKKLQENLSQQVEGLKTEEPIKDTQLKEQRKEEENEVKKRKSNALENEKLLKEQKNNESKRTEKKEKQQQQKAVVGNLLKEKSENKEEINKERKKEEVKEEKNEVKNEKQLKEQEGKKNFLKKIFYIGSFLVGSSLLYIAYDKLFYNIIYRFLTKSA